MAKARTRSKAKKTRGRKPPAGKPAYKRPRLSAAESSRRQCMIVELVALLVVPGVLEREVAERIARKVVTDHPGAWTGELVPMTIAHVERALLEAA